MPLLAEFSHHGSSELEAAIICLLVAALIGGVVYAVLAYGFKVAFAPVAGALTFLIVLALCWL